jgi:hypothetical protein
LGSGNLYTLWNTDEDGSPGYSTPDLGINAIRGLDADLNLTTEINALDMEIPVDYGTVILAGNGFLGILSGANEHAYIIDLDDYSVQDLGQLSGIQNYGSENWADWGVLEYDGTDFSAVYTNWNSEVVRHNLTTDVTSVFQTFSSGLSDMASFTVSPWNNRWYFHYEGSSSVFGGNSETAGYANAGMTSVVLQTNALGCYSQVSAIVGDIDMGADTTVCEYNVPVMLFAGNGYESYTWNGVNNDYNVFAAMEAGEYIVVAVDEYNCDITDTINVVLDECLGVQEQGLADDFIIYPNPTFSNSTLTFSVANSTEGTCTIIDMNGKLLYMVAIELTAGENMIEIPSQSFESGIYLVQLNNNKGLTSTIRLVKN